MTSSLDARTLVAQLPSAAAVLEGPDLRFAATSEAYRSLIGGRDPQGQPIGDILPELAEQGFIRLLNRAYRTGELVSGEEVPIRWDSDGDGVPEDCFFDFSYSPLRDSGGGVWGIIIQVTNVTERVQSERERAFLAEASDVLASSLDYDATLESVTRLAVQSIADWCTVDELAPNGTVRRIAVAHPDPAKVQLANELHERYPPDPDAPHGVAHVLRTGEAEMMAEIPDDLIVAAARDEEHLRIVRELGLRSYITVPLIARGHTLGALTLVAAESGRRYGPRDLHLAEDLARRAAVAIDNARLFRQSERVRTALEEQAIELEEQAVELEERSEEMRVMQAELEEANEHLQRANQQTSLRASQAERARSAAEAANQRLERLQAVTSVLSEGAPPDQVAAVLVEHAVAGFGARSAATALLNEDASMLEVVGAAGYPEELLARFQRFPVDSALPLAETVRERHAVYIGSRGERAARYPHLDGEYPGPVEHAWAAVPLIVDDRVLGALALGFGEPQAFRPEDRAFFEALAQQCAQALERARLSERERRAREREQVLADAGVVLASSLDLEATLIDLASLVVPRVADWCFVEMPTDDGRIEPVAIQHSDPARVRLAYEALRRYPVDPEAPYGTAKVLRSAEPELVSEIPEELLEGVAQDAEHLDLLRGMGFRSHVSVPLSVRGRILGVLSLVMAESGRRFGPADLPFAQELARRAAIAIDNARLYEAERYARAEAEDANRAKTEFLSAMSHELRTPLNAIAGYVDILEIGVHGPLTDTQRVDLARIKRAQEVLLGLITDVLNFARLEAGRVEYRSEPVPLAPLVEGLQGIVEPQVQAKGLTYDCIRCDDEWAVVGDPDRIRQILLNLLTNAVKFTPPGGGIALSVDAEDGWIRIHVRDTGRGIEPEKLETIFDPFVQVDRHRTPESQQGVGLGLAISRELARGMGGEITAESTPDIGSVFTLTMPAA